MKKELKSICLLFKTKKVFDLNSNLHQLVETCFDNVDESNPIYFEESSGTSLNFYMNNIKKNVLFIFDNDKPLTIEINIKDFVNILRKKAVEEIYIKYFVLYFYGDYTINNKGLKRLNEENVVLLLKDKIKAINKELFNKGVYQELVSLFLSNFDVIYFGNVNKGISITKKTYLSSFSKANKFSEKRIKIQNIIISNKDRNISFIKKFEADRELVKITFVNSYKEIIKKLI